MTLTQLEYIVAIDNFRNFLQAAEHCNVTQPTLSMQLQKLELELGIKIFDRSKQPVMPTDQGTEIIDQARRILQEASKIGELVSLHKGVYSGTLRLGIIPTLAPYLLPLFIPSFKEKYPHIRLIIREIVTEELVDQLKKDIIDCGLASTPLNGSDLEEHVLFYEPLKAYLPEKHGLLMKNAITVDDLSNNKMWLLKEGHCLRKQVGEICGHYGDHNKNTGIEYEAGSLETLIRLVDTGNGITILPELCILQLPLDKRERVRPFKDHEPAREISLVTSKNFSKRRLSSRLIDEIESKIPAYLKEKEKYELADPV